MATHACFLGGGTSGLGRGISVLLIGLALLLQPPKRSLGSATNSLLAALVLWSVLPLLPASWSAAARPAWRSELVDYQVRLAGTISPQPWLTLEGVTLLCAAVAALYWFADKKWSDRERRALLRWLAVALVLFASLCLIFQALRYEPPEWHNSRLFGPFPSRNHAGSLLALGAVVAGACAIRYAQRHTARAWWLGFGFAVLVAGVLLSLSRGAVLAFGVSALVYLGWRSWQRQSWKLAGASLSGLLLGAVALWFFAGEISSRLGAPSPSAAGIGAALGTGKLLGFRGLVWSDAIRAALAGPWTGFGFGNFEEVFPFFRQESLGPPRIVHPESDWLWLANSMGVMGLLLALGTLVTVLPRFCTVMRGNLPLEQAAVAALVGFALHSLFDVPGHLLGTALPALLLVGTVVGCSPMRPFGKWVKWGFRLAGLALAGAGAYLALADRPIGRVWPGRSGAAHALALAKHFNRTGHYPEGYATAERGLNWAPLSWQLHFERGVALSTLGEHEEALSAFKVAKLLQPGRAEVAEAEAAHWLARAPGLAVPAWREALLLDPHGAPERFNRILGDARAHPELWDSVVELADLSPKLFMVFATLGKPEQVAPAIVEWRRRDPQLTAFSPLERKKLLHRWWQQSPATVLALVSESAAWEPDAWPTRAHELAAQKEFKASYELARAHLPPPHYPAEPTVSRDELRLRVAADAGDYVSVYGYCRQTERQGDLALSRSMARTSAARRGAPAWLLSLQAELAAQAGAWDEAWQVLLRYATAFPDSGLTL
jgi:O-antigen ligase